MLFFSLRSFVTSHLRWSLDNFLMKCRVVQLFEASRIQWVIFKWTIRKPWPPMVFEPRPYGSVAQWSTTRATPLPRNDAESNANKNYFSLIFFQNSTYKNFTFIQFFSYFLSTSIWISYQFQLSQPKNGKEWPFSESVAGHFHPTCSFSFSVRDTTECLLV